MLALCLMPLCMTVSLKGYRVDYSLAVSADTATANGIADVESSSFAVDSQKLWRDVGMNRTETQMPLFVWGLIVAGLAHVKHVGKQQRMADCVGAVDALIQKDTLKHGGILGHSFSMMNRVKDGFTDIANYFESHIFGVNNENKAQVDCQKYAAQLTYITQATWFENQGMDCVHKQLKEAKAKDKRHSSFAKELGKGKQSSKLKEELFATFLWLQAYDAELEQFQNGGITFDCCHESAVGGRCLMMKDTWEESSAQCRHRWLSLLTHQCVQEFTDFASTSEHTKEIEVNIKNNLAHVKHEMKKVVALQYKECRSDDECSKDGVKGVSCIPGRAWKSTVHKIAAGATFLGLYSSGLMLKNYLVAWAGAHTGKFAALAGGTGKFVSFNDGLPISFKLLSFDKAFHRDNQLRCRATQCKYNADKKRCEASFVAQMDGKLAQNGTTGEYHMTTEYNKERIAPGMRCVPWTKKPGWIWAQLGGKEEVVCTLEKCPHGQVKAPKGALSHCGDADDAEVAEARLRKVDPLLYGLNER